MNLWDEDAPLTTEAVRPSSPSFLKASLTHSQMLAPDLTYSLIRPLQDKYVDLQRTGNRSIVFCLLINRVHFLRAAHHSFSASSISKSRAALCEILATRVLRHNNSLIDLVVAMTTSWHVFGGASDAVLRLAKELEGDDGDETVGNAIEIAILGEAKRFIKSDVCQKVINAIWRCVLLPFSFLGHANSCV